MKVFRIKNKIESSMDFILQPLQESSQLSWFYHESHVTLFFLKFGSLHHAVNWRSQISFYNYVFSLQACRKHGLLLAACQKENILIFKGSYFLSLSYDFTSLTSEFWMLNFGNAFLAMQMKKSMIMQQKELGGIAFLLFSILLVLYLAWVTSIQHDRFNLSFTRSTTA